MKIENHTKTIVAIFAALVILCSAIVIPTMAFIPGQQAAGAGGANYAVFEGVAGNDYYDTMQYSYKINQWATQNGLYTSQSPYYGQYYQANKSLRLGLTEYGEMATPTVNANNSGIAYGANSAEWNITESWANSLINPKYWIQGWNFYMNYTRAGLTRAIEAYALYGNTSTAGGARQVYSWYGNYLPNDTSNAYLTAGALIPSGVEILYDSARLVIGRTGTIIYDGYYGENVAEVFITVVFFKDLKYAIVYKDVKLLLDTKVLDFISDFSFSERYEIDLARGINPSNGAYIHYFQNYSSSSYQDPLTGTTNYDVLQAFNPTRNYTFFAGYWPNATEYTVYKYLIPNLPLGDMDLLSTGTAQADMPGPPSASEPGTTPWVNVQWRYNSGTSPELLNWFAKAQNRQMRFVEVVGMTDYNKDPAPALDKNAGDAKNQVDAEIQYMLAQVFNPEDLNSLGSLLGTSAQPFMWTGLGYTSQPEDSAGANVLGGTYGPNETTLGLFDKNSTLRGTIPYGLSEFGGSYSETFSNSINGTGVDSTLYKRTALKSFAFGIYDGEVTSTTPQPIAGGWDVDGDVWYPSIDPLTQTWANGTVGPTPYDSITYHPNGILSVGGMKANQLTRYFNDFGFAIDREGTSASALITGGSVTGTAPTSDPNQPTLDFFPVSTWNVASPTTSNSTIFTTSFGYTAGYAVISLVRDVNGTRGLSVYGWDGRDTYWASAWASQYILGHTGVWLPSGTVAVILHITYTGSNMEPSAFTVVKALGTITEFGTDDFFTIYGKFDSGLTNWSGNFTVPTLKGPSVWWYAKLPTTSTAKVDFDP